MVVSYKIISDKRHPRRQICDFSSLFLNFLCLKNTATALMPQTNRARIFELSGLLLDRFRWLFVTRVNCAPRADTGACAAVNTDVWVNVIYITFWNCTCRALADTCAACYALCFWDFVSHNTSFCLLLSILPDHLHGYTLYTGWTGRTGLQMYVNSLK